VLRDTDYLVKVSFCGAIFGVFLKIKKFFQSMAVFGVHSNAK